MLTASRLWRCRACLADLIAELEHELQLSHLAARLLALRGVQGATEAQRFLAKRLADLHPPALLHRMEAAAARLASAISERQTILIHGDYDVDGSTATALLAQFVRACGHHAIAFIPHRRIDGYGLGEASLLAVQEHRAAVMVTVDCGIADHGWAKRIESETGCAVIITDHHLPQGALPECTAVCNPNQPGCSYPDKGLAGVGVAWKLAWATATVLCGGPKVTDRLRAFLTDALALVAVGTVADCAPLNGENRILVSHGLTALARTTNPGLRTLLAHARLEDGPISAGDVGWKLGPLLNASGRLGSAMANIRLLTATDRSEAEAVLAGIVSENEERKRLTQILTDELTATLAADPTVPARNTVVVAGDGWHQGVVGIVASRLVEQFGKPAVVIAINDGVGKGSLRTIPAVHLGEAIEACRAHLIKGGGHAMAAGLTIEADKVQAFAAAFEQHVAARILPGSLIPRTDYDADVTVDELDQDFFTTLAALGPFGTGNPEPVLHLVGVSFAAKPQLFGRDGNHLRGALTGSRGGLRELLAWKIKDRFSALSANGARFNLLVRPEINRWRGEAQHRLVFVDGQSV